ncbi:hypothetical protein I2W78_17720 [Streptomyces spinoverrucosus]|uniref:hypothetical protein n=1 Tax=Streptomyces spinoverrucosus TaxID=284043 RepID=UPI0018C3CFE1|nr:hypothetical protein [Streptomyces spinoverrucosus]MBG0853634.1 hypothetical protein [Streptomyces spinoverrucosus]
MAEKRDVATAVQGAPRGRTRWGIFAAVAALPGLIVVLLVGAMLAFVLTDDEEIGRYAAENADCAEALGFGGAALPAGVEAESCTVAHGIDTAYTAVFRMPRADFRAWLADTYPDAPAPRTECADADAELCVDLGVYTGGLPKGVEAHGVHMDVDHEGTETAQVRFSAFTT